jgi:hypothetical protein
MKLGKFNFENKGNSLAELGVTNYAYTYQDMLAYIGWIESKKFVILGGDVYSRQGDMFDITYDSWYYTPKNKDNDSQESISVAKNYIKQYTNSNGENFYFAIVISE